MSGQRTRKRIQINNNPKDKDEFIEENQSHGKKRRSLRSGDQVDDEQHSHGDMNEVIKEKCQVDKPGNGTANLLDDIARGNVSAILQEMKAANLGEDISLVHAIQLLLINGGRNSKHASLSSEDVESDQNIIAQSNQSNNEEVHKSKDVESDQNIIGQSSRSNSEAIRSAKMADWNQNIFGQSSQSNNGGADNSYDAESSENIIGQSTTKKRGYTYMLEIWGRDKVLPPIPMMYDASGKPVGPKASKYSEFLGSIARNNAYCPIDVETWHKMPNEKKMDMLNLVKTRYDTALTDDTSILSLISRKWRNYKKSLKQYWVPDTLEYKVEDPRVSKDQFLNLVRHWNKKETKEKCLKNKDARSKKKMDHHTGKKSFAEIDYDLEKKLNRKPSRVELFEATWLQKEKIPDHVKKILLKWKKKERHFLKELKILLVRMTFLLKSLAQTRQDMFEW